MRSDLEILPECFENRVVTKAKLYFFENKMLLN